MISSKNKDGYISNDAIFYLKTVTWCQPIEIRTNTPPVPLAAQTVWAHQTASFVFVINVKFSNIIRYKFIKHFLIWFVLSFWLICTY